MSQSELLITSCSDPLMWYAHLIGQRVPLRCIAQDYYVSQEPAGFTNFVKKNDAEIVSATNQDHDK